MVRALNTLFGVSLLTLVALFAFAPGGAAPEKPVEDAADRPQDLILLIDVSGSMMVRESPKVPPSDPEGMRWDGVQFILDVARPEDRIALVVFASEAAVLTESIDGTGFVELNKKYKDKGSGKAVEGRAFLKQVVRRIQEDEDKIAANPDEEKRGRVEDYKVNGHTYSPWDGTSIVLTLDTVVKKKLLDAPKPEREPNRDRDTRVLLLTDGNDVMPNFKDPKNPDKDPTWPKATPNHPYTKEDFAYIKGLEDAETPKEDAKLDAWVAGRVRPFQDKNAPIITFAMGGDCDHRLLESISRMSRPAGASDAAAAAYRAQTNLDVLAQLQQVGLELRQTWRLKLAGEDAERRTFTAPQLRPWRDLGVLLYRKEKNVRARALQTTEVTAPAVFDEIKPLESRSHLYYFLTPDQAVQHYFSLDQKLKFVVKGKTNDPYEAFAFVRTQKPLFQVRQPADGATYTPLDAIPCQVDFTPYLVDGKSPFSEKDFKVEARFTPTAGEGADKLPGDGVISLRPDPADGKGIVSFREEKDFVLDPDSRKGRPELLGRYNVDVTVTSTPDSLLQGATLHLPRRTIEIKQYPSPQVDPKVVLSNVPADKIRGAFKVGVDLKGLGDSKRNVAMLTARVVDGSASPNGIKGAFHLSSERIELVGGKAEATIELPAAAWADLAPGEHNVGCITVKAPWQEEEARIDLIVKKEKYDLAGRDVVEFDLSGKETKEVAKSIDVHLVTDLETEEIAQLSTRKDGVEPAGQKSTLTVTEYKGQAAEPRKMDLPLSGLAPMKLGRKAPEPGKAMIGLTPTKGLRPGLYRGTLWVVGAGVTPREITVQVTVDQPIALERRLSGELPLNGELHVAALAGTSLHRTIIFRSSLDHQIIGGLTSKLTDWQSQRPAPNANGADRLLENVVPHEDRIDVDLKAPASVLEGIYALPLTFDLREQGAESPLLVGLLIKVQVAHVGARPDVKGPLRLHPDKPCAPEYAGKFRLITPLDDPIPGDAKTGPVRWWVECTASPAAQGTVQKLEPGLVDVQFDGRSVLPKKGGHDSVSRDRPCALTVAAHCGGLKPGLYRNQLVFHSYTDDPKEEGPTAALDVEVLVPGREVMASALIPTPAVGQEAKVRVVVSCYDCEPGEGEVRPAGGGPAQTLTHGTRIGADGGDDAPAVYEFFASVTPGRGGKNPFVVRWPRYCPKGAAEEADLIPLDVNARGRIEAAPANEPFKPAAPLMVFPGEEFQLRAVIDPATKLERDQALHLTALQLDEVNPKAIALDLSDAAKDGVYAGKLKLSEPGPYQIKLIAPISGLILEQADVKVGFNYKQSVSSGDIYYGGGRILWWWPNHQSIAMQNVVAIENREKHACRWRARLLFPTTLDVAHDVAAKNPAADDKNFTPKPDPAIHLDARLKCPQSAVGPDEDGWFCGVLGNAEHADFGLGADFFQKEALDPFYDQGNDSHPTLTGKNGMVIQVELTWDDKQGQPVLAGRRILYAPVTVQPVSLWWASLLVSYLLLPALVIGSGGAILYWYMRRRRRLQGAAKASSPTGRAAPATDGADEKAAPAKDAPKPAPRSPRRPPGFKG